MTSFEKRIGYQFENQALLSSSLTHRSYAAENKGTVDNQRLEFFGDAVIQLASTRFLYAKYPDYQEGKLTKLRSALTCSTALAQLANEIALGDELLLGVGEEKSQGRSRIPLLEDAFEALCGAICLDSTFARAEDFYVKLVSATWPDPEKLVEVQNPKGALQEYAQQQKPSLLPHYKVIEKSGLEHQPFFRVSVSLGGKIIAEASAVSIKKAESEAAQKALNTLLT